MLESLKSHSAGIIGSVLFVLMVHLSLVFGYTPAIGDTVRQYYPWHQWASEQGFSVDGLWLPFVGCGMPAGANGMIGHFFPLNFPFALPIPTHLALSMAIVLCLLAGAAGTYFLCREYTASTLAAVLGAGVFGSMGAMLGHIQHPCTLGAACWIPWQWFLAKRVANGGTKAYVVVFGFLTGMQLLASHPQVASIGVLSAGLLYFLEVTVGRRAGWLKSAIQTVGGAFFAGTIAVATAAVQMLPMYQLVQRSVRGEKLSYEFVTSYSLPGVIC